MADQNQGAANAQPLPIQQGQVPQAPDPPMPPRGHSTAPRFLPDQPRELRRYFDDLELLFTRSRIVADADKKFYARHYADVDTAELWASIPTSGPTATWAEFVAAVIALYPGAADDRKWTLADFDRLVGEQSRLGIHNAVELGQYYRLFYTVSTYLRARNRLSEREQASAFIRSFQADLWRRVERRLELLHPRHDPDDVYPFEDVLDAAKFVLHSTSPTHLNLQSALSAPSKSPQQPAPIVAPSTTTIKTEDLSMILDRFASTLVKAIQAQQPVSQPPQVRRPPNPERDTEHCNFCGETDHYIGACRQVTNYIAEGKVKRDVYGKVVLPSGARVPFGTPGKWLRDRVDEWHRRNPNQRAVVEIATRNSTNSQQLMYEIQDNVTASYQLTSDARIAALEQEIYTLRSRQVFDGVEVPRRRVGPPRKPGMQDTTPPAPSARAPTPSVSAPPTSDPPPRPTANTTAAQPAPAPVNRDAQTKKTDNAEAPLHPFRNVREPVYAPPHERNYAAPPPRLGKDKDVAYRSNAPIQDSRIADAVYNRSMNTPFITISQQELLSLSPEVRHKVKEAVTPKRVIPTSVRETKKVTIEEVDEDPLPFATVAHFANDDDDDFSNALVIPDPYEVYLGTLSPGEIPERLKVAKSSHALRSVYLFVGNTEYVESIIDPGSQIIAMSEAVCHDLGLAYDPSITLDMQSANGEVDQSLGLARNVPCKVADITLFLQMHVIKSPAYDILLGRPFDVLTESIVKNYANEDQTITICDPNSRRRATIPTIARGRPRHQLSPKRTLAQDAGFHISRD